MGWFGSGQGTIGVEAGRAVQGQFGVDLDGNRILSLFSWPIIPPETEASKIVGVGPW